MASSGAENVVVSIRFRPLIKREIKEKPAHSGFTWSENTIKTTGSCIFDGFNQC